MLILGINDTHDASACLLKDGKLLMAIAEERLRRVKGLASFPYKAIQHIFQSLNYKYSDIDHVSMATKKVAHLNLWNISSDFTNVDWLKFHEKFYYPILYQNKKIKIKNIFPKYRPSVKLGYPLNKVPFISGDETSQKDFDNLQNFRKNYTSRFLKIDKNKIKFYDHHRCHGLYAYYVNSNSLRDKKVAIVTSDSGGDGVYNSISIIDNGEYTEISRARNNLIGKIYESTTLLLGMSPVRHLYKVMGLAPYTSEYHKKGPREIFLNSLKVNKLEFQKDPKMEDHFVYFKKRLKNFRFDGIAGGLQDFVEVRLSEWFKNISTTTKTKNFVFSGGVANNVKAIKVLIEQDFVKTFFVPPGPGDESLSIGAAFAAFTDFFGVKNLNKYTKTSNNAYWGSDVDPQSHKKFKNHIYIKKNFYSLKDKNLKKTAKALASGEIVLFCSGRMEFGPRALGHRSILSDPSRLGQIKKINDTIKKRDFWMPFTPPILAESFNKYVHNPKNIQSNYMTVCFNSTKLAQNHFKAAIHPYDFTIRPQKVSKKTCPKYYELLKHFKRLTGIGGLLNTSLNISDKPIICQPTDIIKEILNGSLKNINYILVEDTLYIKK